MKDSQPSNITKTSTTKYIKESNERFSTFNPDMSNRE